MADLETAYQAGPDVNKAVAVRVKWYPPPRRLLLLDPEDPVPLELRLIDANNCLAVYGWEYENHTVALEIIDVSSERCLRDALSQSRS
ncbi:hypothetical protein GGTG_14352 [Gaeumannomyces tritici R3-111a-1]|uniref:Uncharacterized protein n=1 Tax=Gaeumannomyces tritici (strain R3-111a-1) TaxID=644352 RepID=J3PL99_GAET3|nr:hypothetical protein GGTG_14352 [Gaeumannomyces tritici R3-111a-1]EJT68068.1 hypothetical protein GGTG_14352 [Gaeumannomyces tritici R3-111a-1]